MKCVPPHSRWVATWLGLSLALLATVARAQVTEDPKPASTTVIVFDGSGSMWGKLDGEKLTKLVQSRDAVRATLGKATPAAATVGLMSYGHRRAADCTDVQVIASPESATAPAFTDRIVSPLEKLNPKGKGPLTTALKEAAKVLGKAAGPRSIVLIHDDPDNCQQDACAALGELQQSAPDLVIHVVGLGLRPDEAARYQCLTKPTGGRHVDAQNGAQIATGVGDVLLLAMLGQRDSLQPKTEPKIATRDPVPAPEVLTEKPQPITLATDGPSRLRLRALLAKDVGIKGHPVRWSLWPSSAAAGTAPTATVEGADTSVPASPGTYRVRAQTGLIQREQVVTVSEKGESFLEIVLDAGEIRLKTPLAADLTALVSHRPSATNAKIPSTNIGIWPHGRTTLLVPSGALLVSLEQAELRSERTIEIGAGQAREIDLTQPGGRILLDLMPPVGPVVASVAGLKPQVTVFIVTEDDPDAPRGRREVARSAADSAEFIVAPGSYTVSATRGVLETRERVTVAAGEAVRRTLPLVAARLVLAARLGRLGETADAASAIDTFWITRLDTIDRSPLLLSGPAAIADVPPGRYRIEARRNAAAISAQQEIEVRSGEYKAVTLDYQAGALRMDAVLKGDAAAQNLSWLIVDDGGRLVWSSYDPAPTAILGVGSYTVRMATRGARYESPISIRQGEVTTVRLGQP